MGMIKKAILLTSIFALLAINTASAIPLPESSHYHGTSHFSSGGYLGYIDFAVYDTLDADGDEFSDILGDDTVPGSGQYIYAYQIFSDSYNTIDYFSVLGIGEGAIADYTSDIGTVSDSPDDPGGEGVDATYSYFNPDLTRGIWEFEYDGTHIIAGEHSVFLILRSNMDWTVGGYSFTPLGDDTIPIMDEGLGGAGSSTVHTPEPFTIALLGLGSFTLFYKRRKVVS